ALFLNLFQEITELDEFDESFDENKLEYFEDRNENLKFFLVSLLNFLDILKINPIFHTNAFIKQIDVNFQVSVFLRRLAIKGDIFTTS
ncbi:3076_t:CDS:2, partial [Entrophospora sp. SA101]